jgi:hypothetical protein
MTPTPTDQDTNAGSAAPDGQDEAVPAAGPWPNGTNGQHADELEDVQAPPRPGPEVSTPAPAPDVEIKIPPAPSTSEPSPDIRINVPPEPPESPNIPEDSNSPEAPAPFDPTEIQAEFAEAINGAHAEYWINYFRRLKDALDGGRGGAIELALPSEVIEVNREIECEIYAHRSMRLAGSPTSRVALTLTFDGVRHSRLSGLLGANLKGRVNITINNLQAPIEEDDELALPPAGVLRQLVLQTSPGRSPDDVIEDRDQDHRDAYSTDAAGNVYKPHSFAPSSEDPAKCALCGVGEAHALHEGKKRQTKRNALARRRHYLNEHPFEARPMPEDGPAGEIVCVYCELPEADEIHSRGAGEIPTYADRVAYWIAEGLEEAMAHEKAQADVEAGQAQFMTESDELAAKLIRDASPAPSEDRVADELAAPIQDEDLTEEQRDARRRLADKSGDA